MAHVMLPLPPPPNPQGMFEDGRHTVRHVPKTHNGCSPGAMCSVGLSLRWNRCSSCGHLWQKSHTLVL